MLNKTVAMLLVLAGAHTHAASMTVAGLVDGEHGTSYDIDARFSPTANWSVGAGAGHSETELSGTDFSGTTVRFSTDVAWSGFNAGLSLQRWKDSDQVASDSRRGQVGWMSDSGLALSALIDDRRLTVDYVASVAGGGTRPAQVEFNGTGWGADLAFFGDEWNAGLRFLDYSYGRSMARVRAILNAPTTDRFPLLQVLINSVVTQAAGAPDRELSATLGREFSRSSLQGDWVRQRDALTRTDINSLSLTHGYEFNQHLEINTTLGYSGGGGNGTIAFAGLALTLRN
jgi:hypothetical protein